MPRLFQRFGAIMLRSTAAVRGLIRPGALSPDYPISSGALKMNRMERRMPGQAGAKPIVGIFEWTLSDLNADLARCK